MASGPYLTAASNVKPVGNCVAKMLITLFAAGMKVADLHIFGHSLGGQMGGVIGKGVKTISNNAISLPRVTGLYPAGPLFVISEISALIADFVDIIHTDAGGFGQAIASGTADFWPNGGMRFEPGCPEVSVLAPLSDRNQFIKLYLHTRTYY